MQFRYDWAELPVSHETLKMPPDLYRKRPQSAALTGGDWVYRIAIILVVIIAAGQSALS